MSIESKSDSINIYLGNQETKSSILSDLSPERKYIILQNDTLHSENRNLNNKINELENQIEELETDSAKMERSVTYIKGMLKNFVEIDKLYRIVDIKQTENQIKMQEKMKYLKLSFMCESFKYRVLSILFFIFCFYIGNSYLFFVFDKFLFLYIYINYVKKFNIDVQYEIIIKETRTKIDEIHKAQDYISDLIDNC